jgi:hypothetical protein
VLTIILIILLIALLLGGVSWPRYGPAGLGPLGLVLILVLIFWLLGLIKV